MKIHRFIGDFDLSEKDVEITNPENIKQIKDVLRMEKGGVIVLSDGKGASAEVTIDSIFTDKIMCVVNKMARPADAKALAGKLFEPIWRKRARLNIETRRNHSGSYAHNPVA